MTVPEDGSVSALFARAMSIEKLYSFLRTPRILSNPSRIVVGRSSHDRPFNRHFSELLVCLVRETAISEDTADSADRSPELSFPLEERLIRNSPICVFCRALDRAESTAFSFRAQSRRQVNGARCDGELPPFPGSEDVSRCAGVRLLFKRFPSIPYRVKRGFVVTASVVVMLSGVPALIVVVAASTA